VTRTRIIVGTVVGLLATLGVAAASRVPLTFYPSNDALVRLTWSARPERIEECRSPTADELAGRPAHMRQTRVCEGRAATYRLEVRVNDVLRVDEEVHGGGWRRDRRLYVFHELPVPPGEARVDVRFTRVETASSPAAGPLHDAFVAPRLTLEQRMRLNPREVVLVTYDAARRTLVAVHEESLPVR
jgi:hypothetical protein